MKKYLSLIAMTSCLVGCSTYEPDLKKAAQTRQQNINEMRASEGCKFTKSHAEYKECLIKTYNNSIERAYRTTITEEGAPLAIISEKPAPAPEPQPTCDDNKPDYFIIEVVDTPTTTSEPVPVVQKEAPAPIITPEITEVIEVKEEIKPQITTVTTTETVVKKPVEVVEEIIEEPVMEEPAIEEPAIEEPKIEEPIIEEPVVEEPIIEDDFMNIAPIEIEQEPVLVCPCEDPTDPCPQCVEK